MVIKAEMEEWKDMEEKGVAEKPKNFTVFEKYFLPKKCKCLSAAS